MPALVDIYLVCGGFSFVYIVGTAALGFMEAAGDGGDAGSSDGSGDAGGSDASGDAGGSDASGDAGGSDASGDAGGSDASGDAGGSDASGDAGGSDASGDAGGSDASGDAGSMDARAVASFRSGLAIHKKRLSPMLLLMKVLSPSTITTFLLFFSLAGYLLLHYFPGMGNLSLVPAVVLGLVWLQSLFCPYRLANAKNARVKEL